MSEVLDELEKLKKSLEDLENTLNALAATHIMQQALADELLELTKKLAEMKAKRDGLHS